MYLASYFIANIATLRKDIKLPNYYDQCTIDTNREYDFIGRWTITRCYE